VYKARLASPPGNPFHLHYLPRYIPSVASCLCLLSISVDAPGAYPYLSPNRAGLSSSGVCPSSIPSRIPSSRHPAYCGFQMASILQSTVNSLSLVLVATSSRRLFPQQCPCDRSTHSTTSLRPFSYRGLPNVAFCVLWHRRSCCANAILDAMRIHGTSNAEKSVSRINP
jgi:hypothetical protein